MTSDLAARIAAIITNRSAVAKGLIADRSSDVDVAGRGHARMGILLERLGNPQLTYQTIHIAGSKGKGTTAHLAAAVLTAHGKRTGLYTSPHLNSWNERIRIDGEPISDHDFQLVLAEAERQIADLERDGFGPFNAFELVTATGFLAFKESGCDLAVIEVGLGGRFDSTNLLNPSATVITTIEEEHVDILGPDLATIAWNKAGIMKPGVPVVIQHQVATVMDVLSAEARTTNAPLLVQDIAWSATRSEPDLEVDFPVGPKIWRVPLYLPGPHNAANLGAAIVAAGLVLAPRELKYDLVAEAAASTRIAGRFTVVRHVDSGQLFVLDGAHTRESIGYLLEAIQSRFGPEPTTFVLSVASDKPSHDILERIAPYADSLVFPRMSAIRAIPAEELATDARALFSGDVSVISPDDVPGIVRSDGRPIVVTGSFGVVGDVLGQPIWQPGPDR